MKNSIIQKIKRKISLRQRQRRVAEANEFVRQFVLPDPARIAVSTRRSLLIGLCAVALVGAAVRAEANTTFPSYSFPGTGSPTSRTMPARIADIINVIEYGADPTGVADSSNAIEAALNVNVGGVVASTSRGNVFFPPGTYKVTRTLTLNTVQCQGHIFGSGSSTTLTGNFAGFIFDNDLIATATSTASTISGTTLTVGGSVTGAFAVGTELTGAGITYYTQITALGTGVGGVGTYTISVSHTISTPQAIGGSTRTTIFDGVISGMVLKNISTNAAAGCIRYRGGASAILLSDLDIQGHMGILMGGAGGTADTCFDSLVQKCRFNGLAGYPSFDANGVGLLLGPETAAHTCSLLAWDYAIRFFGAQGSAIACRCESNNVAVTFGMDVNGAPFQSSGCKYSQASMEGNNVDLYVLSSSGVAIEDVVTTGEVDAFHNSTYGIKINGGSMILTKNVNIGGSYVTAGIGFVGGVDTTAPGVTFISTNTPTFSFGALTNQSSLEQYHCKNFPTFSCTVAQLPTYASPGSRRFVSDSNITPTGNFWTDIATHGGGGNTVPVVKDASGVWRVG